MWIMFQSIINTPRLPGLLVVLVSLGALAAAFASEYWGGLAPCVLCIYQRYAYGAAIAVGLAAFALGRHLGWRRVTIALAGLVFLAGAGIAFFHVGVEQLWWRGTEACHAPGFDAGMSIAELRKQLLETAFVPCDEVRWSLFGVSIAGYNVLASLLLAGLSLRAAKTMGHRKRRGLAR